MRNLAALMIAFTATLISCKAEAAEFMFHPASMNGPRNRGGSMFLLGTIVAGDYDRFVAAIKQWGPYPFSLTLRSPGGNVSEALRIGRLVRQLSLTVFAPNYSTFRPNSADCTYDNEARDLGRNISCICASACTLIFMGGVYRMGSEIYVHSIAYDKGMFGALTPQEADAKYKQAMTEVRAYLAEMDVDDKFASMMTGTSSSDIRRVTSPLGWEFQVPSFREWLNAKCGQPGTPTFDAWTKCTTDAQNQAEVEAIKRLVLQTS